MHCGKCGAFISKKNRFAEGRSTAILIICRKCGVILTVPFDWNC